MDKPSLALPIENPAVESALQAVLGIFLRVFPERICSVYVDGSYADRTTISTSDIDLTLVFQEEFDEREYQLAKELASHCEDLSGVELDIDLIDEHTLQQGAKPSLKFGSLRLYGEDSLKNTSVLPIDVWGRERMHAACWLIFNVFHRNRRRSSIDYPNENGEFYGYDNRTIRLPDLPDGREVPVTRNLVRVTGWTATALIAHRAKRYVSRKSECHQLYQECFDDGWGPLLESIYDLCRTRWQYRIPETDEERQQLRHLCRQTLSFENFFFAQYKRFVLSELNDGDEIKLGALKSLEETLYRDRDIITAIQSLAKDSNHDIAQAARHTLEIHREGLKLNLE